MLRIVPVPLIINMITIVQKRENKKQKERKKKSLVYLPAYVTLYNSIKKAGVFTFK